MGDYNKETLPELFEELISLEGAKREHRLAAVRTRWPDVAAELERLLNAAPSEAGLPQSLPGNLVTQALQPESNDLPEEIGGYRVKSLLGVGGMGAVYLGYREDLGQSVALKVAHRADPAKPRREILNHEARILAGLNHPHIAPIIDWDTLPDGRQLIVTAYVNGQNILQYCAEHELGVVGRIRLFRQVVDALAYAHANLVIHRDIKPGNILVDDSGNVYLIDFGIARNLEEAGGYAQTVNPPATPEYASPEQLAGKPLTILSDVYSLGAVLFELLTGCRPFTRDEKWRVGADEPPPRASKTALAQSSSPPGLPEPRVLANRLRGDLDTILAKALAGHPGERYHNASALGEDLQRFVERRPIAAQRPSFMYLLGKAVSRNRAAAIATAAAVLALISGITFGGIQWQRAAAEREQAIESRDDLRNYSVFLERLIKELDAYSGGDPTLTMDGFMARALERLKNTEKIDHERRAWFSNNLASVFDSWGDTARALESLNEGLENAKISATPHDEVSLLIEKALILDAAGRYQESIQTATQALRRIEEAPETAWRMPYAHMALAEAHITAYRPLQAIEYMDRILKNPERQEIEKSFAAAIKADALGSLHRHEKALQYRERALSGFLDYYGDGTVHTTFNRVLLLLTRVRIDPDSKIALDAQEIISTGREVLKPGHPGHARFRSYIAEYHFLRGDLDEAVKFQRQALDMIRASEAVAFTEIMPIRFDLVRYLVHSGRPGEAATVLRGIDPDPAIPVPPHLEAEKLLLEAWLALIDESPNAADAALGQSEELLADTPYDHLKAELDYRRAQLAAARDDWSACAQHAASAAQLARQTLPAAWSLPDVYAALGQQCWSRQEGTDSGAPGIPTLPTSLPESPWAGELRFIHGSL